MTQTYEDAVDDDRAEMTGCRAVALYVTLALLSLALAFGVLWLALRAAGL